MKPVLPKVPMRGLRVCALGCGDGTELTHPEFEGADCHGCDISVEAINRGRQSYPHLKLVVSKATGTHYDGGEFDVVMSRVALVYTDMDPALKECRRILKSGGHLFLTMHTWKDQTLYFWRAVKKMQLKRTIDHLVYVYPVSIWYAWTGKCFPRPWGQRDYEHFQTHRRLRKHLQATGFAVDRIEVSDGHFQVEATAV